MKTVYNLEYRILDKLGRTKSTRHGGLFLSEEKLEQFKQEVLQKEKSKKIAFDVYVLERPLFL